MKEIHDYALRWLSAWDMRTSAIICVYYAVTEVIMRLTIGREYQAHFWLPLVVGGILAREVRRGQIKGAQDE